MPQHQQMYGAPPPGVAPQVKPEHKAMSYSGIKGEYRYELRVEQQPQRARMCGFGDKDRRPITPPPCVRLIITHKDTGVEVDPESIEGAFFILQVDLWDKEATREVNTGLAQSTSKGQNGVTVHSHVTITTTSKAAPQSTATAAAGPTLSTTAIAGTAAGGTVGIALVIGLVFLFMRRRKRQSSLASPADIWEPSRNTSPKPKLPNIQHDSSFGRYSEMGAGVPVRQRSKAELHSENIPVPRPQTGYFRPPEMHDGSGENSRYYQSTQRPDPHHHGSNMDSRYPEMSSHAVTSMPSPTSPISQTSTMQGWHLNSSSGGPTVRLSSADLRSEGMRSPVSELGTNAHLRSTRSAELHGAGTMSPMSELSTGGFHDAGRGAAELHNEPLLPPQLDSRSKGEVPDGVVGIDDSDMHRAHRPGVSTNF
jgi:hypothetical protein